MITITKSLMIKKLMLLTLLLFKASLYTFGSSSSYIENYCSISYDRIETNNFTLEKINVPNPYGDNNELLNEGASTNHYGYYAGEVVVDFSE